MEEIKITKEIIEEHGLLMEEYEKIKEILGREPNINELGIFSVMWSEHCGYKNSLALLRTLPTKSKRSLSKTGEENAGVIDIGDGYAVVFKIESHNHPSALEPYQGAATGVGGILRDIFTMGARPIASINSLRFGELKNPRNKYLFNGVVKGIADYGNCFGVPTVAGEVYFDDCYDKNPLVNAMTVGIIKKGDRLISSKAKGPGNSVMVVGARTGRDGIHGATFASVELTEESEEKRTAVQVGDPFTEKLLLEATLELADKDYLIAMQDMGAAGLTSSSSEMSAKGNVGIEIDVAKVPVREEHMTPYEILLSESQERMLLVVKKGYEKDVEEIFNKWELQSAVIGKITDDGMLRVKENGKVVAEIPNKYLLAGEGAPVYIREDKKPEYLKETENFDFTKINEPNDYNAVLLKLLASPTIASKEWIYTQYDHMVRTDTVILPGSDAALMRIKGTKKGIAISVDCNSRYVYLNPYEGTKIAVAECARNIACSGATPLGLTNCLNYGNPYDPEIYWQLKESIRGMKDICLYFDIPVTGGNVSLYNESGDKAIFPTPTIGMVGVLDDIDKRMTQWFKNENDIIILIGENKNELGGTEYLKQIHNLITGNSPILDLELEKKIQDFIIKIINYGLINSAHDCSEGGLAVALAECCVSNIDKQIGCEIKIKDSFRKDALYFGETQSRIIISLPEENLRKFENLAVADNIPYQIIGKTGGKYLKINNEIKLGLDIISTTWRNSISKIMDN